MQRRIAARAPLLQRPSTTEKSVAAGIVGHRVHDPAAAARVIKRLGFTIRLLRDQPTLGKEVEELASKAPRQLVFFRREDV